MANISAAVQIETRTEHELSNQFQSVMGDQSFNVGTLLILAVKAPAISGAVSIIDSSERQTRAPVWKSRK
jgi:hypothetical protein